MTTVRKKVLWVDDEIEYLRSHIMFLETRGYSVTPVFSGDDAIHLIAKKPDEFDIVLLDEQMPGKGGLATLSEIKEMCPDLPVVMVTKSEEEELMEEALGRNIDGYLTKPVNPSQILLVCKRLLHSKELVSMQVKQNFARNYSQNRDMLQDRMNAQEWISLYSNLAKWDIELEHVTDEGIRQAHSGQVSDANSLFSQFIIANYMRWMSNEGKVPVLSPKVLDTFLVPRLSAGERVCFVVVDGMRMDQYLMLQQLLKKHFFIENHAYFSILPSTAEFARNSLFSGLYPAEISRKHPEIWRKIIGEPADRNAYEGRLMRDKLERSGIDCEDSFEYRRLVDEHDAQESIDSFDLCKNKKCVALVVDFIQKFIGGQANSPLLQDIASDDTSFRKLTYTWFARSKLLEMLRLLAAQNCTVIFTSSGGSILCTRGTELYGASCIMDGLRYRYGVRMTCDERFAFYMHEPVRFNLPEDQAESNFIVLKENYYFVNHSTYHEYNKHYMNTFQRGGISLEEIIVPLAVLRPRQIDL